MEWSFFNQKYLQTAAKTKKSNRNPFSFLGKKTAPTVNYQHITHINDDISF